MILDVDMMRRAVVTAAADADEGVLFAKNNGIVFRVTLVYLNFSVSKRIEPDASTNHTHNGDVAPVNQIQHSNKVCPF
jgi:hypothetical protein